MHIELSNVTPADHPRIIEVIPQWWGGRDLRSSVPKLFLIHFSDTSFVAEHKGNLCGFLIGFLSQASQNVGYIHFVGVHPDYRRRGIARDLYEKFFTECRKNARNIVRSCTAPENTLSIDFHRRMGFSIEPGTGTIDGIPITTGYLRNDDKKVLFKKVIAPQS